MRHFLPLMVALLAFGSAAPAGAAGQEASPASSPTAAACIAPPLVLDTAPTKPGTPAAEAIQTAVSVVPGDEAPLPPRTPPAGTPAGAVLLDRIRAAEENLARCFNAGDYAAFTALFTPKALLAELGIAAPGDTAIYTAGPVLLRGEVISVSDAQTHADGRVSADVVFAFEGQPIRARDVFVETDGWLLLDEIVEIGLAPHTVETPTPLDEETLQALSILGFPTGEEPYTVMVSTLGWITAVRPGGTVMLVLGVFDYEVCGIGNRCFVPAPARVTWSVTPATGARIDATTGDLTIDPATPSGSVFTVRADVEEGRRTVETQVRVFTAEGNPLVGYWAEEAQLTCGDGQEVAAELPIEELVFAADGTFAVTWRPFESYNDYWGTYAFDLAQGTLDLTVTGGNDVPPDLDGQGGFTIDAEGRLLLTDLWLGTPHASGPGQPHCGHRFFRLA